ncbi:DNA-binding transcriptional regulator [Hoeflea sp. TYP-13]|uniref:DNA-binding transcriptional regulator n=1 Tax=Hoeflea sp. TYP-13 TaxID=3230023 RepID=UPI0034C6166B
MTSFSPVRAVERTLLILEHLNQNRVTRVSDLHDATGLPKPTIVRLLQTLEQTGYVSNDPRHGGYQVTSKVTSLSAGFHGDPLVVEAGRAHAAALTNHFMWPATIAILHDDCVIVRYSTIPDSPNSPFHATVNMRLSLNHHALGLAYLAFCPPEQQNMLIKILMQREEGSKAKIAEKETLLRRKLRTVKEQGFAERDANMEPRSSNTIAMPVMNGERVLGTLGITYYRAAHRRQDAVQKFSGKLQTAVNRISRDISRLS